MAQRQFRSDDTSTWTDKYGNGSDGVYSPSTSTDALVDSACTGTINTTSLSATNASFTTGQLIFIHQTQGTGAGQWELNKIASYTAGTITLAYPLIFDYVSGAQVLVMSQYSSGSIAGGVTVTCKSWNGTVGGIYAKFFNGSLTVTGNIVSTGTGYRGGTMGARTAAGQYGEGTPGPAATAGNKNANGNGGGADSTSNELSSGAGGGNGTAGSIGLNTTNGGAVAGTSALTTAVLGGGGSSGSWNLNNLSGAANGGVGGGFVLLIGKSITVTGSLVANGGSGASATDNSGGRGFAGGGGAGGSVLLKGQSIILGSSLVTAAAGAGGTGVGSSETHAGGVGGVGRIHADYSISISGTTSPTIDTRQDSVLATAGGNFFLTM